MRVSVSAIRTWVTEERLPPPSRQLGEDRRRSVSSSWMMRLLDVPICPDAQTAPAWRTLARTDRATMATRENMFDEVVVKVSVQLAWPSTSSLACFYTQRHVRLDSTGLARNASNLFIVAWDCQSLRHGMGGRVESAASSQSRSPMRETLRGGRA